MNIRSNTYLTWLIQILFWGCSYWVLLQAFSKEYEYDAANRVYTILFHIPLLVVVYGNWICFHRLLLSKRIALYCLAFIILAGLGVGLHFVLFEKLSDEVFPGYYFISYFSVRNIANFMLAYLGISLLLFFFRNWFTLKNRQLRLEKENTQARMDQLKAQINPHFLFNSLNNIYAKSRTPNGQVSDYILKLSDSLRYMIYDADSEFVPLEKEIQNLKAYFDLEKLRLDQIDHISFSGNGDFSGTPIAPLLFLPLVENLFKFVERENPVIELKISYDGKNLRYQSKNNITDEELPSGQLGERNVQQRLALIYPGKHSYTATKEQAWYHVDLNIQLAT